MRVRLENLNIEIQMSIQDRWKKNKIEAEKMLDQMKKFGQSQSLHYVIDNNYLGHMNDEAVESILKKSLLYSEKLIILTDPSNNADSPCSTHSRAKELLRAPWGANNVGDVYFFPKEIKVVEVDHDGSGSSIVEEVMSGSFSTQYNNRNSVKVSLDNKYVSDQLAEQSDKINLVKLWLPHVRGIDLKTFMSLRVDEADAFSRMHYVLKTILNKLPTVENSRDIIDLAELVDYEIRNFENDISKLKRKNYTSLAEIGIGVSALGLCSMLPDTVEQILSGVVGAHQFRSGVNRLLSTNFDKQELKLSDFYIAWLIHRESLNALPS